MTMNRRWTGIRAGAAAVLSAAIVGIVGVAAIPAETAQAAGVVVERHPPYGQATGPARDRKD
jgi:hypothetical protein